MDGAVRVAGAVETASGWAICPSPPTLASLLLPVDLRGESGVRRHLPRRRLAGHDRRRGSRPGTTRAGGPHDHL